MFCAINKKSKYCKKEPQFACFGKDMESELTVTFKPEAIDIPDGQKPSVSVHLETKTDVMGTCSNIFGQLF